MASIISVDEYEEKIDVDNTTEEYRQFRDSEGIPVHTGLYAEDIRTLETDTWERTGQQGAFLNLYGMEGVNDIQIHEISPGEKTTTQHHLYDEIVYVAEGNGFTTIGEGEDEITFEWSEHSLFYLPKNVPYRHINGSDSPSRLIAETPLPQILTMFKDEDFLLEPLPAGSDTRDEGFYDTDAKVVKGDPPIDIISWIANFVPDIKRFDELSDWGYRGAGGASVLFPFPKTSMFAHISEFPAGRYKKAHRHHPGANVAILSGEGFSLMWREGWDERIRIPWKEGSMFTPPARWYHQHFNTGGSSARYFALHGPEFGTLQRNAMFDPGLLDNQIEYVNEDPEIRELYQSELEESGGTFQMPEECYTNSDYEFEAKIVDEESA